MSAVLFQLVSSAEPLITNQALAPRRICRGTDTADGARGASEKVELGMG